MRVVLCERKDGSPSEDTRKMGHLIFSMLVSVGGQLEFKFGNADAVGRVAVVVEASPRGRRGPT